MLISPLIGCDAGLIRVAGPDALHHGGTIGAEMTTHAKHSNHRQKQPCKPVGRECGWQEGSGHQEKGQATTSRSGASRPGQWP